MAKILDMPKLSPTMEEGQLSVWHKKEGDAVSVDDLLAEVETDKATMEFRSFDKGTILKILVPAGSIVKLGQPVAIIGQPGEEIPALPPGASASSSPPRPSPEIPERGADAERAAKAPVAPVAPVAPSVSPSSAPLSGISGEGRGGEDTGSRRGGEDLRGETRVRASPYVRKIARDNGLDLRGVVGSGPGGRVIARDVGELLAARAQAAAPAAPAVVAPVAAAAGLAEPESKPLSMMRKTIARRLTESKQTVPHFYLTIDVDAEPLVALREQINRELASSSKEGAEKISVNDLLIRACAVGLVRVPECNAQFAGDAILYHRRVDISVAVAVADGLVTPVVRDADRRGVLSIARAVRDLAARAKTKKLAPDEMMGGTFSISNLGMFGIDAFAAVINPPEGAILAVGRVRDEPVIKDGAVVPGKRLALTLSCDHRVVDGAVGARFLAELRSLIERPMQLLLT